MKILLYKHFLYIYSIIGLIMPLSLLAQSSNHIQATPYSQDCFIEDMLFYKETLWLATNQGLKKTTVHQQDTGGAA